MNNTKADLFGKIIAACAYVFLALPFCIFAFGWLKPAIGIPAGICALVSVVFAVKSTPLSWNILCSKQNTVKLCLCVAAILVWVYLSGIGKFVWQNDDHRYRNAIFKLLVEKTWPVTSVIDGAEYKFVYYLGFWLPAGLAGKIFGLQAGFIFQYIWAVLGVCCMFLLVCIIQKRLSLKTLAIIIFFSGLDYAGQTLIEKHLLNPVSDSHLEWWARYFQYSSMTTQLFWVFNQIIPAWVAVTLLLAQKNSKNVFFILGTLFLNATFAFMGLLPIAFYIWFAKAGRENIAARCFQNTISFQNIAGGGIAGIITFLFFRSNVLSSSFHLSYSPDKKHYAVLYALFFILETGVYLALVYQTQKKNPLYYISGLCLAAFPLFYIPTADFVMRASIPALFVVMLFVIDEIENKKSKGYYALVLALLIGSITPWHEIARTVFYTYRRLEVPVMTEETLMEHRQFVGDRNSFFFKYLAKDSMRSTL